MGGGLCSSMVMLGGERAAVSSAGSPGAIERWQAARGGGHAGSLWVRGSPNDQASAGQALGDLIQTRQPSPRRHRHQTSAAGGTLPRWTQG
jgi:hypothetical protein